MTQTHDVSRRDFLRVGGAGMAGVAATLGIGSIVGETTQAQAAEVATVTDFVYTCPVCGQKTTDFEALKAHFAEHHPDAGVPQCATLTINGTEIKVQVEPQWTLRETLQKAVGLTGCAKQMCDRGGCGSCSVLIDGVPALSCSTLAIEVQGRSIETSEGIAATPKWRPLVEAYAKHDAAQCGYCTPGQFTVAKYIIEKYGEPTAEQIREELAGNICRCGTYSRHVLAIQEAAAAIAAGRTTLAEPTAGASAGSSATDAGSASSSKGGN